MNKKVGEKTHIKYQSLDASVWGVLEHSLREPNSKTHVWLFHCWLVNHCGTVVPVSLNWVSKIDREQDGISMVNRKPTSDKQALAEKVASERATKHVDVS